MSQLHILFPVFALVALTIYMIIRIANLRMQAVRAGDIKPFYFKYNRGAELPEYLLRTEQNYSNLLELPILFYVGVIICFITQTVDIASVVLAWLYVISRYAHSWEHVRTNKLLRRRRLFIYSCYAFIAFWCKLVIHTIIIGVTA